MSNKAKKTNIVNIRVTSEEKLNWELKAHAEGLKTSQLARYLLNKYSTSYAEAQQSRQDDNKRASDYSLSSAARQLRVVCVALD